jgi:hypothetical protein
MDFTVTSTVTLPRVSDFPNLTPCEKQKVQDAIDNTLAPHEQDHVKAFETYNGQVTQPFNELFCQPDLEGKVTAKLDALVKAVNTAREAAANAKSAALDPFNFNFDLDCDEEKKAESGGGSPEAGGTRVSQGGPLASETETEEEDSWWI